jgi:hypothetical protein
VKVSWTEEHVLMEAMDVAANGVLATKPDYAVKSLRPSASHSVSQQEAINCSSGNG